MMKWWFIFVLRGMSAVGPYDTEQECLNDLKKNLDRPVMDQGFDGAKSFGVCFQGSVPSK